LGFDIYVDTAVDSDYFASPQSLVATVDRIKIKNQDPLNQIYNTVQSVDKQYRGFKGLNSN